MSLSVPRALAPARYRSRAAATGLPGRWVAAVLGGSLAALTLLMHVAGLRLAVESAGFAKFALVFAVLVAIRWAYREPVTRWQRVAGDIAEYAGISTAISLMGAVASYPVAAFSHGYADAWLQRADEALRFDWLAWYRVTAAHPALQLLGRAAYETIYLSPTILVLQYAWTDQRREAYRFMAAVWLAAALTLVAYRFMPAVGPFAYLWHGAAPYMPTSDLWQPDLIPRLRLHEVGVVDLGHLVGLVSAPSFHTAAAVLLIAFAARQPGVRGPLIALNVAMLLATPVEGTHYLIDLVGGAAVALVAIAVVRVAAPQRPLRKAKSSTPADKAIAPTVKAVP